VEVVGDEVQNLEVGQRVVCVPGKGGWSEKVVVNSENVFPIPDSMSFEEAAAIPVNYITAYMMLFNVAHLRPGKKLLIHMAAGGVGTAVTQLARTVENVTIFGTASASKHDVIRKAGVTHPIDYRTLDYEQEIKRLSPEGIDIVLDPLAGKDFKKGYNLLRPMGITVLFGGANLLTENKSYLNLAKQWFQTDKFDAVGLIGDNKTVAGFDLGGLFGAPEAKEAAVKLIQLYEEGEIKPRIDSTFSFDQIADAQKRMHDRQNIGKIILVPYKEEEQKPEAKPEVEETEEDKTAEKDKTAEEDKPTEDGE
jgi:NADPH:quinone reductase-like Zn-dependent oxidoreductase